MAIYLVDYENVYIEGLQGLEQLGEEDTLHIFYTQNRCGLTFDLYQKLTTCRAKVQLGEVSVSPKKGDPVKNALDIQLMMYTGYLIGTHQSDRIFIVSKDKDFQLGTEFFQRFIHDDSIDLRIVPSIESTLLPEPAAEPEPEEQLTAELEALTGEVGYTEFLGIVQHQLDSSTPSFAAFVDQYAKADAEPVLPVLPDTPAAQEDAPNFTVQYHNTVRNLLGKSTDEETVNRVCEMIHDADSLVDLNNALARYYRDGQRAKTVYHKFKPRFEDLRHLSRARNKG